MEPKSENKIRSNKMGRELSEDLKKRMQRARKRRELGYTRHLEIAGEMVRKKVEELFDEWDLDVTDSLFIVDALDWEHEPIFDLQYKEKDLVKVVSKAVEYMEKRGVSDVGIWSSNERVGAKTERTGNVIFIRKKGSEYLVESHEEWNERIKGECDHCAKKVETNLEQSANKVQAE